MTKFLNSSIVDFENSAQFGGGSSEVSFTVNLVDCELEGDSFNPPSIGAPVLFQYDGFEFYGLTDRYSKASSMSAYPQYTVHLTNGLFLLQGVKLILNDYYGASNAIPNLVNVFGYLENSGGFGASEVNDAGISWNKVANAVSYLCNHTGVTPYGRAIAHKSYKYGIDFSALPAIPNYYRINSDSVSLLEFVQEVCEAGGHDFFINLEQTATSGLDGKFVLHTISRLDEPTPGAVANYINSAQCVSQKEVGQELRKDATSKFVVGAPVERMWFIEPNTSGSEVGGISSAEYAGYNVLPYFGNDIDGNYIVGYSYEDDPDEYYFDIDIRDIGHPNLGDTYTTSERELKAAKKGREAWEIFLGKVSCNKYKVLPASGCGGTVVARPFVIPVPTGKNSKPMNPTGDYGGEYYGYTLSAIPKFGHNFMEHKELTGTGRKTLPTGLTSSTYYYEPDYTTTYPLDGMAGTASCQVNSWLDAGPATANQYQFNLYYPSSEIENPYYLRAFKIGTVAPNIFQYARLFESDLYRLSSHTGYPVAHRQFFTNVYDAFKDTLGSDQAAASLLGLYNIGVSNRRPEVYGVNNSKADELYKKIKNLADNYYGKRFMVLIPSMYGAIEPESNKLRLSQSPSDAGYLDSAVWDDAYVNGIIPSVSGLNTLLTPEEKFYPYVKINQAVILDTGGLVQNVPYNYSNISPEERVLGNPQPCGYVDGASIDHTGTSLDLWIKCSVSENIVYRDNTTLLLPRAIVELPGTIDDYPLGNYGAVQQLYQAVIQEGVGPAGAFTNDTAFDSGNINRILNVVGVDETNQNNGADPITPDLFAVPLRSNLLCYGPWYLAGATGPIEYERNEDLAPWNYGGYAALDAAGFSRVTDGVTNQTFDETGSVTVAGAPALTVGEQLISGGPYITDLNVSASNGGISTQYTFQSWSSQRRLSKLTNFNSERIKRLSQVSRDLRRSYREGVGNGIWRNPVDFMRDVRGRFVNLEDLPKRERSNTSHKVISAQVDGFSVVVVSQPGYNAASQAEDSFEDKAIMSLDGLFRPYSNHTHSKMSSLTMPDSTGAINTSLDLYPLRRGHDISLLTSSNTGVGPTQNGLSGFNTDVEVNTTGVPNYRGIALKGPIMVQGWGRDISGDPVPLYVDDSGNAVLDSGGNKQFAPDYLYNPKIQKTGPVDLQWDDSRGVWTIPGSGGGGGSTSVGDCGCGCDCADGYDLTLSDGTKTTRVMKWVAPSNIEIDVANGHIWLPSINEVDSFDAFESYYPLTYVNGSDGTWSISLTGNYLQARYSDYISEVDGSLVRGPVATTGVAKSGTITFKRKDTTNSDLMSLTVVINGTIASTGS